MGYLDDINTLVKTAATAKDITQKMQHKSFARGALDGTLQFPCLVSDAIPIDMASTIARTLERVYASFVQSYLSLNNTIDISVDKNPNMFLKRFHKNIKLESTAIDIYNEKFVEHDEEFDKMMERVYDGTTQAYINRAANKMIVFNFSESFSKEIFESHRKSLEESLAYIDFEPFPNIGNSPFYEAPEDEEAPYRGPFANIPDDELNYMQRQHIENRLRHDNDMMRQKYILQNNDKYRVPELTSADVKKSNDLQPYLIQVRLMAVNDQNEFVQFMDFLVGIKVVLHNIKSDEMVLNIQNTLQNNGKIFNFIRWTTGEKSLFKDLLLRINDVKLDVANKSKGASPWWSTLKRLKETSRAQAAFFARNQLVPNSTLVISAYDADLIEKNYGYNIKDPKFAIKLMNSLFLMNFAIVDDGTRTVDILYDGENTFQTYALETLERELMNSSNRIGKELTRMISR